MDFSEALLLMRQGKKVRRANWITQWHLNEKGSIIIVEASYGTYGIYGVQMCDLLATDWEEVK